jgi:hypothetical protein
VVLNKEECPMQRRSQPDRSETLNVLSLVAHERQARDRGWWPALERCYTPKATIQSSWFDGSATDYLDLSKRMFNQTPSTHRLGLPVIDVLDDRAVAEVPMTIEFRGTFRGEEIDLTSHMRMLHRVQKSEDGWRFAASVAIFDRDTMTAAIPGATPRLTKDDLVGTRPSYRMLSVWMTDRGYTVPADRYGIDQPTRLAKLYEDTNGWAGLSR